MDLYAPYYILADIVCMLFLSLNLYFAFMGVDKQMHKRYLAAATVMAVLYFAADIYWTISEYGTASEVINSNTILYFIMCLMGFSLTLYNLSLQDDDGSMLTGPFIFRLSIPMLINMAAILTTRWTHIYFWVTDKAELVTNPFGYFIMVLFGMGYPLSSCSIALVAALKKKTTPTADFISHARYPSSRRSSPQSCRYRLSTCRLSATESRCHSLS